MSSTPLSKFGGVRGFDQVLLKTPVGFMELSMSAKFKGDIILYAKEITTGNARFFKVSELLTGEVLKTPAFITGAVLVTVGVVTLLTGLFTSFHSYETYQTVQIVTANTVGANNLGGELNAAFARFLGGPTVTAMGLISVLFGGLTFVMTARPAAAFPAIIGGLLLLSSKLMLNVLGLPDSAQTTTPQTVKKMSTKFTPDILNTSLMAVGLAIAVYCGYSLLRFYKKSTAIKSVMVPGCETIFDLFSMEEIPLTRMDKKLLVKFNLFDGAPPGEAEP